jgi:segregation and condensation protein A
LDLLLQLIERAELDITKLALSQITDQYLLYLNNIIDKSSQNVSEFIVIASKLIQIKSEALLPRPPIRDSSEEDPGESLARQLREYKRFKEISSILSDRQDTDLRSYSRLAPSPNIEPGFDIEGITLQSLVDAALAVFSRAKESQSLGTIVSAPRITIREKISQISDFLFKNNKGTFRQLFVSKPMRIDLVVTFLAMLELVKLHLIFAKQNSLFDDIEFEKSSTWDRDTEIDLEFGE